MPSSELTSRLRRSTKCSKNDMRAPASSPACDGELGSGWAGSAIAQSARITSSVFVPRVSGVVALPALESVAGVLDCGSSKSTSCTGSAALDDWPSMAGPAVRRQSRDRPGRCIGCRFRAESQCRGTRRRRPANRPRHPPRARGLSCGPSKVERRSPVARLNSAITLPRLRANSGSFSGPKTTSATTKMMIRCGMLNISGLSDAVFAS